MMTIVNEMESRRCNLPLILAGFGLPVMFALIVSQCSTVLQLQTMRAEVNFIKVQLQQQQTLDDGAMQAPCIQLLQVSTSVTYSSRHAIGLQQNTDQ